MKKDKHLESQKRLEQILDSIALIEEFSTAQNLKSFCQDDKLNNAVMMRFVAIGEAIKALKKKNWTNIIIPGIRYNRLEI